MSMLASMDVDAVVLSRHCIVMASCRLSRIICVLSEDVSFVAIFSAIFFVYSLAFFNGRNFFSDFNNFFHHVFLWDFFGWDILKCLYSIGKGGIYVGET